MRITTLIAMMLMLLTAIASAQQAAPMPAQAASPLRISGIFPAAGGTDICPDSPLRITFSAAPTLGSAGRIQIIDAADNKPVETIDVSARVATRTIGGLANFNFFPAIITGNTASIYPHPGVLAYGKSYYVTIDKGAFHSGQDEFGGVSSPAQWRFTTKLSPPPADSTSLTVAADGAGDFCTVQGALDFIPDGNSSPRTIVIRAGNYPEMIYFANKHGITLRGEDRHQSVIEYSNNLNFNRSAQGGSHRSVFQASRCNDLVISNLTIRNTSPQGASQAEAIILNGTPNSHAILTAVDLCSFQDTVQINGQAYLSNCYIEGDVDFMWGTGPCFFRNCQCRTLRNAGYYTAMRNPPTNHGFVYDHCTFDGAPEIVDTFLSRGGGTAEVVLLDCVMTRAVADVGWLAMGGGRRGAPTSGQAGASASPARGSQARGNVAGSVMNLHFAEFDSHDPNGKPVDVSKRLEGSRQLKQPEDAEIIANYSNPTWVLGGWEPKLAPVIVRQPVSVSTAAGSEKTSFDVTVLAVPEPTYRWQKDGVDIAGQTSALCYIPHLDATHPGNYRVIVSNSAGSITSDIATLKIGN